MSGAITNARSPETAVLMAVYGGDRLEPFRAALSSVLEQDYAEFDLLLMLDGPIAPEILRHIHSISDPRLRVFRSAENRGLAAALNVLIEAALASGYQFLARMDSDDLSYRERLGRQIAFLRADPAVDVVGSWCDEVDEQRTHLLVKRLPTTDAELKQRILERCPFIHPTVVFRRRVFEDGARYRTDNHLTEDMFLWVDLAKRGRVFANVPASLLEYRVGATFYRRRRGLRKACSEFRAKRYIARELRIGGARSIAVPCAAFALRVLPAPLLKVCYRLLR